VAYAGRKFWASSAAAGLLIIAISLSAHVLSAKFSGSDDQCSANAYSEEFAPGTRTCLARTSYKMLMVTNSQ